MVRCWLCIPFCLLYLVTWGSTLGWAQAGISRSEDAGSAKMAFIVVPAGTELRPVIVGDAATVIPKGREIVVSNKGVFRVVVVEADVTVGDLAKKWEAQVDDILQYNFRRFVPDPARVGFSPLYVASTVGEKLAIPFLNATWDPALKGIVARWGGGPDQWFRVGCPAASFEMPKGARHAEALGERVLHNLVLLRATKCDPSGGIEVNVSGSSPTTGAQRRIGFLVDWNSGNMRPTLGGRGTEYENKP